MPLAYAATQNAISAAADQAWYLIEVRKRSRDMFDNLLHNHLSWLLPSNDRPSLFL
jgi:hypothetical protein